MCTTTTYEQPLDRQFVRLIQALNVVQEPIYKAVIEQEILRVLKLEAK